MTTLDGGVLRRRAGMVMPNSRGWPPHEETPGCERWGCMSDDSERQQTMRNPEQNEILGTFLDRLSVPTGDGGNKRAAGTKPLWKVDPSHKLKMLGHLIRWLCGERVDKDSGAHPLDHVAWRALAIAWQETNDGPLEESAP